MRALSSVLGTLAVTLLAGPAAALNQSAHLQISREACRQAGLPASFCQHVGVATADVDALEWNDLGAHAQTGDGEPTCEAADRSYHRVRMLGIEMRIHLEGPSEDLGRSLGRALHTIQDNCAHAGMPNPQHAWHSLADACTGTHESPDLQPEALQCARRETAAILTAFQAARSDAGLAASALEIVNDSGAEPSIPESNRFPPRAGVCHFLTVDAGHWDGVDRRWNNDRMVDTLREALLGALRSESVAVNDLCADVGALLSPKPNRRVATSGGKSICQKVWLFCLDKTDGAESPPPWEEPAASVVGRSGCTCVASAPPTTPPSLALLLLALVAARSARRVRSADSAAGGYPSLNAR